MRKSDFYLAMVLTLILGALLTADTSTVWELVVKWAIELLGYGEAFAVKVVEYVGLQFRGFPEGGDLALYGCFLLVIAAGVHGFLRGVGGGNRYWSLGAAMLIFPVANLFVEPVWFRRGVFALLFLPVVPVLWFDFKKVVHVMNFKGRFKSALFGFFATSLLIFIVPGFYLPPFFDGIAGWYVIKENPKHYSVSGVRVTFKDGEAVWFKPSFFNPITMRGRAIALVKRRDQEFYLSDEMAVFLKKLYASAYPSLAQETLPTGRFLGGFSYSPHTFDRFDSRENYQPPEEIISFEHLVIKVASQGREVELLHRWAVPDQ